MEFLSLFLSFYVFYFLLIARDVLRLILVVDLLFQIVIGAVQTVTENSRVWFRILFSSLTENCQCLRMKNEIIWENVFKINLYVKNDIWCDYVSWGGMRGIDNPVEGEEWTIRWNGQFGEMTILLSFEKQLDFLIKLCMVV